MRWRFIKNETCNWNVSFSDLMKPQQNTNNWDYECSSFDSWNEFCLIMKRQKKPHKNCCHWTPTSFAPYFMFAKTIRQTKLLILEHGTEMKFNFIAPDPVRSLYSEEHCWCVYLCLCECAHHSMKAYSLNNKLFEFTSVGNSVINRWIAWIIEC